MRESSLRTFGILAGGLLLVALLMFSRPQYLANPQFLGALIVGQILLASLAMYKESFFVVVMAAFLWAGIDLPMSGSWLQGRWIVLALGALVGLAIYMRDPNHRFYMFHFLAFSCVLSAAVSASGSAYPQEALLKSLSLFLLFLYGATGARLAVPWLEPQKFFRKLLLVCEVITYATAVAYFLLRWAIFGNPNSMGAIMGVVVVPVLLWGFLCAESVARKRRLASCLVLATALLMSTYARAGIAGAAVSSFVVCIAMRKYRLMIGVMAASLAIAALTAVFIPQPIGMIEGSDPESISSLFLYKGKAGADVMASRRGPWDQTVAVIKEHPWFGSGFGTSISEQNPTYFALTRKHFVDSRMIREHGNSYLAIAEWSGLLGVFPFYFLIGMTAAQARTALMGLRRSGNIFAPAVPAAAIILAGLIDAGFEDWLFAVGYYLSVFLWVMAFILADLLRSPTAEVMGTNLVVMSETQVAQSTRRQIPQAAFR
ncbi:MAG TPA: O-antigen ligase family protein [Terriglobales bacterium]|nr:O-antigen ligase family protein [Terriglobales bacterium]